MTVKHLTEVEIQQYVLEKFRCSQEIIAHMERCDGCKALAASYGMLFAVIEEQPVAAFDFDLREVVLQKLDSMPEGGVLQEEIVFPKPVYEYGQIRPKPVDVFNPLLPQNRLNRGTLWLWIVTVLAGGWGLYFFRNDLASLFTGISPLVLYFILVSVVALLFFLLTDMYKRYQRKMNILQHFMHTSV